MLCNFLPGGRATISMPLSSEPPKSTTVAPDVGEVPAPTAEVVLLVEDEPHMVRTLSRILERRGYAVTAAANGREAIDHLAQEPFDLLVTDLNMPRVTGQELLDGIRLYALDQFGPMAITVLEEWGIRSCADFGEMVFEMIEVSLLAKNLSVFF